MIITKRSIPRRTVLRGVGAAMALPLLDGMVPALRALAATPARAMPRLGIVYVPNGIGGPKLQNWTPRGEGAGFELSPILEPLAPFRDRLLVLSGLHTREADARPGEGAGDHSRGPAAFLTGAHAKKTDGVDLEVGTSMDQIAARELGRQTQLASLELGLESRGLLGSCDTGYSCAYQGTIAWRTPSTPLPMENDPRAVFERLFGTTGTTDARARLARIQSRRSLLDAVTEEVAGLDRRLGPRDRVKLKEYLDAVRDVERRIQMAEEQSTRELPVVEQPAGIPGTFDDHAKLMFDLQVLAYQCDLTRVITFMIGREVSSRTYPEIGVPDPHHPTSHHQSNPEKIEKNSRINTYHVKKLAYFLERLQSTPDGEGSLLDQMMILYGSGLSDGNLHNHENLPILLVGGGAGQINGGRHVRYPADTPLANLHVTLLHKMGIPAERLGDSTGETGATLSGL